MGNLLGGMPEKRLTVAAIGLGLGLALGSCGSTSGYMSDHWPHWAGGLPEGVPPRPGAPGYQEFIAHKPTDPDAGNPGTAEAKPAAQAAPSPPSGNAPPNDAAVARGGLY